MTVHNNFETVTVTRTESKELLRNLKELASQSAIKIVDIKRRDEHITIVFRRLASNA